MKEQDIVKALECCKLTNEHQCEECVNCPLNEIPQTICQNLLAYYALKLIKKGGAE